MSTTTLRLPEELKARIERLAAASGSTVHGFMVDTLAQAAEQQERQQSFDAEVQQRWQALLQTGEHHTHEDMRSYAMALARGETPVRPVPRKMSADELAKLRASARRMGDE